MAQLKELTGGDSRMGLFFLLRLSIPELWLFKVQKMDPNLCQKMPVRKFKKWGQK